MICLEYIMSLVDYLSSWRHAPDHGVATEVSFKKNNSFKNLNNIPQKMCNLKFNLKIICQMEFQSLKIFV